MFGSIYTGKNENNSLLLNVLCCIILVEKKINTVISRTGGFLMEEKDKIENNSSVTENEAEEVVFNGPAPVKKEEKTKESEEVTFAGTVRKEDDDVVTFAGTAKKEEINEPVISGGNDADEDSVVFAKSDTTVKRHAAKKIKKAKKVNKVPVIIGSVLLIAAAAGGIWYAVNFMRQSGTTMVETHSEASQASKSAAASEKQDKEESVVSSLPVIREESAEIKQIDTATIVFGDNVTVSGVSLSGKTLSEAYEIMQEPILKLRDEVSITVNCDGKSMALTEDDFVYNTDLSNVLIQAYHFSRGELDDPTVDTVYNNGKTDFIVHSVIDPTSVNMAVKKVTDKFNIQPVDAHVKEFNPDATEKFTYEDGKDGYLLDNNVVTEKINSIIEQPTKKGAVSLSTKKTPFKVSLDQIKANTRLIASHYTTANNIWASNHNMELAIKSANGIVVKPGETFSFNATTGDTTNGDLGYVESKAYVRGKIEMQYGGGICQAATTLYLCALKADMEVVERHAHQFASAYADIGLDATIDYGNLDMQVKNTKDYAIYIATYVYDYNGDGMDEICAEMYGPASKEYDEIVPVGWVTKYAGNSFSGSGAKVYFKDGKEVKREKLPSGGYDIHYESYDYLESLIPADVENGPANVSPTGRTPAVLSPNGVGSCGPIPYGQASQYLS